MTLPRFSQDAWLYDCPHGCTWESRLVRLQPWGEWAPYAGVACPVHEVYCTLRRGA